MNHRPRMFIIIGGVWLLIVLGCWYFSLTRPGIGTRWKPVPAPPEQVLLLKLGMNGEILAQTPSGQFYELSLGSNSAWRSVIEPTQIIDRGVFCNAGDADGYLIFPPPGKVRSRVSEYCFSIDVGYHLQVVLLENGEIWSWKQIRDGYVEVLLSFILLIAFMLGAPLLLLGLVAIIKKNWGRAAG